MNGKKRRYLRPYPWTPKLHHTKTAISMAADTGGNFATGVVDTGVIHNTKETGGKFVTGVVDTGLDLRISQLYNLVADGAIGTTMIFEKLI